MPRHRKTRLYSTVEAASAAMCLIWKTPLLEPSPPLELLGDGGLLGADLLGDVHPDACCNVAPDWNVACPELELEASGTQGAVVWALSAARYRLSGCWHRREWGANGLACGRCRELVLWALNPGLPVCEPPNRSPNPVGTKAFLRWEGFPGFLAPISRRFSRLPADFPLP